MAIYTGINGAKKKLSAVYGNRVGAKVALKEVYAGYFGAKRLIYKSGTKIGTMPVGTVVKISEDGVPQDYLIVHQGLPSSSYDSSCDGTWLLRKDILENYKWHTSAKNKYETSGIHDRLNGAYMYIYDDGIKTAIKQVKIPYYKGGGTGGPTQSGANGLSCKIFLLSGYEVGWDYTVGYYLPQEGSKLDYFILGTTSEADEKRVALKDGHISNWWTRSPLLTFDTNVWLVETNGSYNTEMANESKGIRPAFILPSTQLVSSDGTVLA